MFILELHTVYKIIIIILFINQILYILTKISFDWLNIIVDIYIETTKIETWTLK